MNFVKRHSWGTFFRLIDRLSGPIVCGSLRSFCLSEMLCKAKQMKT